MNDPTENPRLPDDANAEEVTKAFQSFVMEPIQKVSLKIDGFEAELEKCVNKVNRLEERVNELEAKFEEIYRHLKKVEPKPPSEVAGREAVAPPKEAALDINGIIAQVKAEEQKRLSEDQQAIEQCLENAGYWLEHGKRLNLKIKEAAASTDEVIANSNQILETLPEELNKELGSSQQGLNIIGRMLQRLIDQDGRLKSLAEEIELADKLHELGEDEWMNLLEGETDPKSAQKKINKKLDLTRRSNYKLVSQAGELADKRQKTWLDVVGKQVLPILDGIIDGKHHTSALVNDLMAQHQDAEPKLQAWFNTYVALSNALVTMLKDLDVHRMAVEPGMMIDFERHEPSSVEADPSMENEQIKEISRDGYEYVNHNGDRQTLRVARVVAIRNND